MTQRYTTAEVQAVLQPIDPSKDASEVHGTLCGMLCADPGTPMLVWLKGACPDFNLANLAVADSSQAFTQLYEDTCQQLDHADFEFNLLLPDDDISLGIRADALGEWCQGFLFGLALGGVSELELLPDNVREVAEDLAEIGFAGVSYDIDETEEDNWAYADLVEHVRVAVMLLYEELIPTA